MAAEIKVQVVRKSDEATDIISLELASCNGAPLPPFSAGSHIDVVLPNGQRRQYSLCNDPEETHRYQIAVLREVAGRGGSVAMHALREGDVIAISPPRNHFALSSESGPSLLLAGGIGITPILCMAERLSASSAPFDLHYFSRSAQRTAFRDRILTSPFASSCNFHYDDEPAERKIELEDLLRSSSPEMHLYVCGPAGFMEAVLATARGLGWAETRLHYEFFSAPTDQTHIDEAFQIQLASSALRCRD
jgi:vanillate O-demethylase ferredoxin subunit